MSFAARLRAGEPLLGALVRMPNEGLVELSGLVGLDFVVIDTEHGPGDQLALLHHLTAAASVGCATIVRVGAPGEVLRVLDLGADGILVPHVSDVASAQEFLGAAHYPPRGVRGFATYSRSGRYGLRTGAEHHAAAADTVVLVMLEDQPGLDAVDAIAALDGVDGLMLGPADYACDLGVVGRLDDPRVLAAARAVRAGALDAGIAPVSIVGSPAAAREQFAAGTSVVMYNVQAALGELFTGLAQGRPRPAEQPVRAQSPPAGREPLVLLSGMLGDASLWDDVAAALVDVAVPQTARTDLDDSVAEMAATVLAAAPAAFALAGHSLGAVVALEIMRQAPQRVTRLALVNAGGHAPSAEQIGNWQDLLERVDGGEFGAVATESSRAGLPATRRDDAELLDRAEAMAHTVGSDGLRRQLLAQQGRTGYLSGAKNYDVPVLIVGGELDDVCPPARQDELLNACPRAQLVTLRDVGHMAPLERPAEVAAAMRAWLAR